MSASTGRLRSADIHDRYELGIGELVIDLRDTDLPAGDVPINVDVGMGEARVLVPEDVCVATSADIGMGNVAFFGRDNGGIDIDFDERPDAEGDATRLLVDAEIGVGELRVDDDVFFDSRPESTSTTTRSTSAEAETRPARPRVKARVDRPHVPSLVAGLALLALGAVLLLNALDAIELSFASFAPVACAATGAILLANGLSRRE